MIKIFNTVARGKGLIIRIGKAFYLDVLIRPYLSLFIVIKGHGKFEYPSFAKRKEWLQRKFQNLKGNQNARIR